MGETARGARKLQIHIETDSSDELRSTLERLPAALEAGLSGTFRATAGSDLTAVTGLESAAASQQSSESPQSVVNETTGATDGDPIGNDALDPDDS